MIYGSLQDYILPKIIRGVSGRIQSFLTILGHICFLWYDLLKFKNEGNRLGKVDLNI